MARRPDGTLELEVLGVLWRADRELTPGEVPIQLGGELAYRTVMTVLARLHDKALVTRRPAGRAYAYRAERWADEAAVACVQGDRPEVARTLARVALADEAMPATAAGIARLGVTGRFEALLDPPHVGHAGRWAALMVAGLVAVTAAGFVQLHHLSPLVRVLCG